MLGAKFLPEPNMADDDLAPQLPASGTTHRLWSSLRRVWARSPQASAEVDVGYESAQPWDLTSEGESDAVVVRS
jgi:hypothetical protein